MKILVDADACPVKDIVIETAKKFNIPVTMYTDTSHLIKEGYATVVTVDKALDSVDIALINDLKKGDIVVTQDYGVAALSLGKEGYAINQNGIVYTNSNIDRMLFERHIGKKLRKMGRKISTISKRTDKDNEKFEREFISLIQTAKSLQNIL